VYFVFDNMKQYHLYFLNYSFNQLFHSSCLDISFYFVYYFRSLIVQKAGGFKNYVFEYVKNLPKTLVTSQKKLIEEEQKKILPR
jgi:hypothetical protein